MLASKDFVIVIEGPAGSGKSWLSKIISKDLGISIASYKHSWGHTHPASRYAPTFNEAANQSLIGDLNKAAHAAMYGSAIIDRFAVSQWVYGQLRLRMPKAPQHRPEIPHPSLVIRNAEQMLRSADLSYYQRHFAFTPQERTLQILWVFMLPMPSVIEEQRKQSGRNYPWGAQQERDFYSRFYEEAARESNPQMMAFRYPPSPEDVTSRVRSRLWMM